MPASLPWDLLRTFEAVARLGSLTTAAAALGVSQSTVSRHLARLEESSGSPLLLRESPVRLTQRGSALLGATRPMVEAALAAQSALEDAAELSGQVTLTTVGELVRWELTPLLPAFYGRYPQLRLRILADNQITSLAAGEADVALRWARPERGDLFVRRLHTERYGYFTASTVEAGPDVPWLGLTGSLSAIPEQRHVDRAFATRPPRLLVEDVESLGQAVEAGLGVALLPLGLAARLGGLLRRTADEVGARESEPLPERQLFMVVHRSRQQVPKVRAVIEWVDAWASARLAPR